MTGAVSRPTGVGVRDTRTVRRGGKGLVAAALLAPGVAVLGAALAGAAGPEPVTVTYSDDRGLTPPTAAVAPGQPVQFANGGASPLVVLRTGEPTFRIELPAPSGSSTVALSTPTVLATRATELPYEAAPAMTVGPVLVTVSPTPGLLRVTPSPAAASVGKESGAGGAGVAAGTGNSATGVAPASAPGAQGAQGAATFTTGRPPTAHRGGRAGARTPGASGRASPLPAGSASGALVVPPGGVLVPVPLPVGTLPTAAAGPDPELFVPPSVPPSALPGALPGAQLGAPPVLPADAAPPDVASLLATPADTATGIAGTSVPARRRGLPLALAAVVSLGMGALVVRVVLAVGSVGSVRSRGAAESRGVTGPRRPGAEGGVG